MLPNAHKFNKENKLGTCRTSHLCFRWTTFVTPGGAAAGGGGGGAGAGAGAGAAAAAAGAAAGAAAAGAAGAAGGAGAGAAGAAATEFCVFFSNSHVHDLIFKTIRRAFKIMDF